jgi:hypothetical protein
MKMNTYLHAQRNFPGGSSFPHAFSRSTLLTAGGNPGTGTEARSKRPDAADFRRCQFVRRAQQQKRPMGSQSEDVGSERGDGKKGKQ